MLEAGKFNFHSKRFSRNEQKLLQELDIVDHYTRLIERENVFMFFFFCRLHLYGKKRVESELSHQAAQLLVENASRVFEFYENVKKKFLLPAMLIKQMRMLIKWNFIIR